MNIEIDLLPTWTNKQNPPGPEIGEQVYIKAKTKMVYDENNNRQCKREPTFLSAVIIGGIRRQLGKYTGRKHYQTLDGIEDNPPYIKVTTTIFLYQVRVSFCGKIIDVHPDDIIRK